MSTDGVGEKEAGYGWVVGSYQVPSFGVDWTYRRRHLWTETGERLSTHPRSPCLHEYIADNGRADEKSDAHSMGEDIELNGALVGVLIAEDAVRWYEAAVGIRYELDLPDGLLYPIHRPLSTGEVHKHDTAVAHSEWRDLVAELLGGILTTGDFTVALDPDFGTSFMASDTASLSDLSLDSDSDPLPTTPDAESGMFTGNSFDEILSYTADDGRALPLSPSKPLNAAAMSFVPAYNVDNLLSPPLSTESYDLSSYEFHFPSLTKQVTDRNESRSVPPTLQRDEYGFYTEVSPVSATRSSTPRRQPGRTSSGLLNDSTSPSLSRSSSKTRELVDQLRSSTPSRRQRKKKGEASSLRHSSAEYEDDVAAAERVADEADGWIMGIESIGKSAALDKQEGWVQELFQCRSPSRTRTKKKSKHERSSSTSTSGTANRSSSTAPHPIAATPMSNVRTPSKQPLYNGAFPPMQPFVPFATPFPTYSRLMPTSMVPQPVMVQLPPPQAWQVHIPPVVSPVMYPTTMPMFMHRA